ncbi:MAG: cytochrome c-type biosis protein CcmE [Thermoleophilaceae bacterium]|jgi:cytochrome c-type biogenesis protein CcmE|nr:cytochrome c-type biosis protein CcmE [Thermoleophilaceae bacterium]
MDPSKKRKIRLIVALSAAVLLAGALLVVSFSTSTEAKTPSQVLAAGTGGTYEMSGKVVTGSVRHEGATLVFKVRDRDGSSSVPVAYTGTVPDPFRDGREVVVTGQLQKGVFVGQRNSLITKCPSKFQNAPNGSKT